jgi:Zn-dependent hydrolases, including glyoxylases
VAKNVYLIENSKGANVYLLDNGDSYDLIDSGIFKESNEIILQLEENGFSLAKLRQIILTHCHCDHIGGVAELVRISGAKVAAHTDDIPFILQNDIIGGPYRSMMVQEQMYMRQFHCVITNIDTALSDGDVIDTLGGLYVIHVPGHTPGSIALYQADQKIMFFGDVIRNKHSKGLVIGVPEKFNIDTSQVVTDANNLLNYEISYALFGHGAPILENTKCLLSNARTPNEALESKKAKRKNNMSKTERG